MIYMIVVNFSNHNGDDLDDSENELKSTNEINRLKKKAKKIRMDDNDIIVYSNQIKLCLSF